jgi:hypothetical protein
MMSGRIDVQFDNEDRSIIRWDFIGYWTWDDWHAGAQRAVELRQTTLDKPVVPAIFNLHASGPLPTPLRALPHIRAAAVMMYPDDFTVIAHPSGMVRLIAESFFKMNDSFRRRAYMVETLDDARRLIAGWTDDRAADFVTGA